jgi:hypothetical protein
MHGTKFLLALSLAFAACDRAPTTATVDAGVMNVSATSTNQPPVANYTWSVVGPVSNSTCPGMYKYKLDASSSYDPDGSIVQYSWYEDGQLVWTGSTYQPIYLRFYNVAGGGTNDGELVVTDNAGATASKAFGFTPGC